MGSVYGEKPVVTKTAIAAIVLIALLLGSLSRRLGTAPEGEAIVNQTTSDVVRPHQHGQDLFKSVLSEDVDWQPFPALPAPVRLAVIVGHPTEAGPYTIRVKVPRGVKLMPHRHPEDRVYTIMSGVFYIGLGDRFDPDKLQAFPPGSVIVLPGNTAHFHWAKSSDYVAQVTAIGPLGLEYVDSRDDPRHEMGPMVTRSQE
jgi:quercetin dioxygenase-like cupin family protein